MRRARRVCLASLAVLAMGTPVARGQGIQVSPVVVELAAGQMASTLILTNTGANPVTVQVRPFAWTQAGTADSLAATDEIAISPPITTIGAGEAQTFRIVARRPAQSSGQAVEAAYRLLIDQLPASLAGSGVQFALRLSIPLFLEPPGRAAPLVDWRITVDAGGAALVASNHGNTRTRLLTPEILAGGARRLGVVANGNPYILPRGERSWRISGAALQPGTSARLTGQSDTGRLDLVIPVTAR